MSVKLTESFIDVFYILSTECVILYLFFLRAPEPPYTLLGEPPEGRPEYIVAEMHMPKVVRKSLIVFRPFSRISWQIYHSC